MRFAGIFFVLGVLFVVSFVNSLSFNLVGVYPENEVVSINLGENQTFTIQNNSYNQIEWRLDNKLVAENVLSFKFETNESGVYSLRVNVVGGDLIDLKSWSVIVKGSIFEERTGISWGEIVFYMIVAIILIIIFLVVRLFILEKRESF